MNPVLSDQTDGKPPTALPRMLAWGVMRNLSHVANNRHHAKENSLIFAVLPVAQTEMY